MSSPAFNSTLSWNAPTSVLADQLEHAEAIDQPNSFHVAGQLPLLTGASVDLAHVNP